MHARLGLRRAVAGSVSLVVTVCLVVFGGHVGAHVVQNVLVPGLGLHEQSWWLAVAVFVAATASIVAWVEWGVDWVPVAIVVGSSVASGVLAEAAHEPTARWVASPAAHEFPLVVVVVTGIVWLRNAARRLPVVRGVLDRRRRRHSAAIDALGAVDRSRTAAVLALAGDAERATALATDPRIAERARRVGLIARARRGPDPCVRDHAAARAALALAGALDDDAIDRLRADATRTVVGVPASEPTWVRPLDATLAAVALTRIGDTAAGDRWATAWHTHLSLRNGHRPAGWWTPLGIRIASAPLWEHAAASALARAHGWHRPDQPDADWLAVRRRLLGAAARGSTAVDDERAIAAGRLWLAFVDDEQAARILSRPTVQHDPLAVALDRLASHLADPCDHTDRKDLVA